MRSIRARLAFAAVIGALALGACNEEDPSPDAGPTGPDGGQSLDCGGVLECAGACSDGDEPCLDACVARADAVALGRLSALVDCTAREGCGEDDACILSRCAAEVAACGGEVVPPADGGVIPDAGPEALPTEIEGTMIDRDAANADTYVMESTSTVRFVRDDAAGEAAGYPSATHAFYRIAHIEYRAVVSGTLMTCSHAADQSVTFDDPDPLQNHLRVARAPGAGGLREYTLITTLERTFPGALHLECDPGGAFTEDFDADHSMANGTTTPRGDGWTFRDTASLSSSVSTRTWTWDLTGR